MTKQFYERLQNVKVKSKVVNGIVQPPNLDFLKAKYVKMLDADIKYTEFLVTDAVEGRLDIIANTVYGRNELWWVIGMFNAITNPMYEVVTGKKLKIPSLQYIDLSLSENSETEGKTNIVELR